MGVTTTEKWAAKDSVPMSRLWTIEGHRGFRALQMRKPQWLNACLSVPSLLTKKALEWASRFCEKRTDETESSLACDILIFVATSTEQDELEAAAKEFNLSFVKRKGEDLTYFDLGAVGTYRTKVVRCKMGPFGHGGSAAQALIAKKETKAVGLISLGMAFGIDRDRQNLGDVLVSTSLLPYDSRTVICPGDQISDDFSEMPAYRAAETLLNMLRIYADSGRQDAKVRFGAMLTGGARIHCAHFRDRLARALSDRTGVVIGGEMEGAGLLSTCPIRRPNWVLVKGISDFADQRRKEEIDLGRPLACRNSARFLLEAMLNFNPENQSP